MLFSNLDFALVYVDPSIGTAGDGSTPSQALKDLPAAESLADKTCYLIRRTDETVTCTLPSGTNANLQHILFLGMPLPTDTAFVLVPEEAKAAWGGDAAERANIATANTSATLNMANLRTFLFHRIYLYRTCDTTSQYLIQSYQTSEYKGTFAIEHCKMGVGGVDIENSSWTGPAYEQNAMLRYFFFGYLRYLRIKDCVVNFRPNTSDTAAIYCHYPEMLCLEDTQVTMLPYTSNRSAYALTLKAPGDFPGVEATLSHLSFRYVVNGSDSRYFAGGLRMGTHLSTRLRTITAESVLPAGMAYPTEFLSPYCPLLDLENLQDFSIRGITAHLPHVWRLNSHLLRFAGSLHSPSPGIEREIADVSITLGSNPDVAIGGHNSYDEYKTNETAYYAFYSNWDGGSSSSYMKPCKVDNITLVHPRGRALYSGCCRLTGAVIQGMSCLYRTMADITSQSTWFPGYAMRLYSFSHVRLASLTVNQENPTYPYNYDVAVEREKNTCNCFIEASNVIPEPINLTSSDSAQQHAMVCASECEEGHYTFRTQNIAVDTWNVRRVGGAPAALKLWNDKWNNAGMAILGRKPFKGKLVTAAVPGRYLLKAHIAYKNYPNTDEMNRRFFLTATVDEGAGNKTTCSSVNGRWTDDDDAIWENDSNLTQKCLELPVDVETPGTVDVRLYFSWFSADGFLYVDPAFTLELQDTSPEPPGEGE